MFTIKEPGKISNKKNEHCDMTMQKNLMLLNIIILVYRRGKSKMKCHL